MQSKFEGQVVLVTGAARGIGRAIALRFARLGADVAIADVKLGGARDFGEMLEADSVEAEIRALGQRAIGFEGDLGRSDQADALIDRTMAELGGIDVLVNCAGGAVTPHATSHASSSPDDEIARTFAANYNSMVYCCRAAIPHMRAKGRGAIVNIGSVAGIMSSADGSIAHYGAAKAAVINYTRSLAGEIGPDESGRTWSLRGLSLPPVSRLWRRNEAPARPIRRREHLFAGWVTRTISQRWYNSLPRTLQVSSPDNVWS